MRTLPTFWRHVATVLGGAIGAQLLPLLAAPLLTRICTPQQLGAYSVWLGVITLSAIGASLRMESAMILDASKEHQRTCMRVVFYSSSCAAIILTLAALALKLSGAGPAQYLPWTAVLSVGVGTWLIAGMQTLLAYATSCNAFGRGAQARVVSASAIVAIQLTLLTCAPKVAEHGASYLIAGHLAGLMLGFLGARLLIKPPPAPIGWFVDAAQRAYLLRHHKFWRYSLPSNLLNGAVSQLPLFLIGMRHGALTAGLFALTQRVLSAPVSLLAASILEVFKRESVLEFREHGHCSRSYLHTFKALLLLGLIPAGVLLVAAPTLFALVFGENWRPAGELAQLMAPLFLLNFVASPLSYVFFVAGRQREDLLWQVALFVGTVTAFLLPLEVRQSILCYVVLYCALYLVYLQMSWNCSRKPMVPA